VGEVAESEGVSVGGFEAAVDGSRPVATGGAPPRVERVRNYDACQSPSWPPSGWPLLTSSARRPT